MRPDRPTLEIREGHHIQADARIVLGATSYKQRLLYPALSGFVSKFQPYSRRDHLHKGRALMAYQGSDKFLNF